MVAAHSIERGVLVLSTIFIGKDCSVGMQCVLSPDSSLDNGITLESMSMVPLGTALPPMTSWEGAPVRLKKERINSKTERSRLGERRDHVSQPSRQSVEDGDVSEAAEGTPLSNAAVCAVQCFGFFMTLLISWVSFLPISLAISQYGDMAKERVS